MEVKTGVPFDSLLSVLTNAVSEVCAWVIMVIWDATAGKQQSSDGLRI